MTAAVIEFPKRGYFIRPRVEADLFGDEQLVPQTRRGSLDWLCEQAVWKPTIRHVGKGLSLRLEPGEVCCSYSYLATAWNWSRGRVQHWLRLLEQRSVITTRQVAGRLVIAIREHVAAASSERVTQSVQRQRSNRPGKQEASQRRIQETTPLKKEHGERGRDAPSDAAPSEPPPTEAEREYVAAIVAKETARLTGNRIVDPLAYEAGIEARRWRLWLAGARNDGGLYKFSCDSIQVGPALFAVHDAISQALEAGCREKTPAEIMAAIDSLDRLYRQQVGQQRRLAQRANDRRRARSIARANERDAA
jgi:hypothetical protein